MNVNVNINLYLYIFFSDTVCQINHKNFDICWKLAIGFEFTQLNISFLVRIAVRLDFEVEPVRENEYWYEDLNLSPAQVHTSVGFLSECIPLL